MYIETMKNIGQRSEPGVVTGKDIVDNTSLLNKRAQTLGHDVDRLGSVEN